MPGEKTSKPPQSSHRNPCLGHCDQINALNGWFWFCVARLRPPIHILQRLLWKADKKRYWLHQLQHLLCYAVMMLIFLRSSSPACTIAITPGTGTAVSWTTFPTVPKVTVVLRLCTCTKALKYLKCLEDDHHLFCETVIYFWRTSEKFWLKFL